MKKRIATDAEKIMYLAIYQADCALSMNNLGHARTLLGAVIETINTENTYIAQAAFGLKTEKVLRKYGGVMMRNR